MTCSLLIALVLVTQLRISNCQECNSFKNVPVAVRVFGSNREIEIVVNGCLEPKRVSNKDPTNVAINRYPLQQLGKHSFRHLQKLESIYLSEVDLIILKPRALWDLPNLKYMIIHYNNNLKNIPKDVFNLIPSIERLDISQNKIITIEPQAFANMPSLKEVKANSNAIKNWNIKWFDNSTNLEMLHFASNKIRKIPRRAFSAFPKLRVIFLHQNEITTIEQEAFWNVVNLEQLDLRHNRLTVIEGSVFPNKIRIGELRITSNRLNFLPIEMLNNVSVREITVSYNPWKCSCLDRIHDWIRITNGTLLRGPLGCAFDQVPDCVVPKKNSHTCLEHENFDEELTRRYITFLKNLRLSIDLKYCVRLHWW